MDSAPQIRRSPLERVSVYAVLTLAAFVFLLPFYWLATSSVKSQDEIFSKPETGKQWLHTLAPPPHWDNFQQAYTTRTLVRAFVNSAIVALVQVTLTLFFTSLAGMAFARYKDAPGNRFLFGFVLATMLIPGAVTVIPVFLVMTKLHLINTYWAMVLPGAASAFGIFWMRQYIASNVPPDLYEAARIDGATEFTVYWRIVVPIIKPALAALGVLTLIGSWNNLMWAYIVLRTPNMYTLPILIYLMRGEQRTDYGMIMACGLIATLPLVIAFLVFQRSFISGVTSGAVKS